MLTCEQFSTSFVEGAFVVVGLFNLLLPTTPPPPNRPDLIPSYYLPSKSFIGPTKGIHLVNGDDRALLMHYQPYSTYGTW